MSNNPPTPPGWHLKSDGSRGYWDGRRWLELAIAPLPPPTPSPFDGGASIPLTAHATQHTPVRITSTTQRSRRESRSKALGITALILGVSAFVVGAVPLLGVILGLIAVALGTVAVVLRQPKGLSITGLALACTGLFVGIVSTSIIVSTTLNSQLQVPKANTDSDGASYESPQVGSPVGDDEVDVEINDAVAVVGDFWHDHFAEFYPGATYQPPQVAGAYDASSPPSCGGELFVPYNAYYCPVDNTVGWDADLMGAAHEAGDAVVYLIVAHEWGHAIQSHNNDVWTAEELQADCFAAAALYGAEADGDFTWEPGDTAEITHALTELADETPWTDTTDHGDPLDRIDAFNEGRLSGVPGCFTDNG